MKKTYTRSLWGIAILVVVAASFPFLKKSLEIRSQTRKWSEKWVDRSSEFPVSQFPNIEGLRQVPVQIDGEFTLTAKGSPWVVPSNVRVEEGAILSIEPGAELMIAPLVDIQVFGRIVAVGTPGQPIRIHAYATDQRAAWAGMLIRSDEASTFEHVEWENSIYGAKVVGAFANWSHCTFRNVREICSGFRSKLVFENCVFDYRAYVGAGNINVMKFHKGYAQVEGSDFYCPNSEVKVDAIDADFMAHILIRGNRFWGGACLNSDAVDVGEGSQNMVIEDNLIVGFVDKGVSVGENAEARIDNNVIVGCGIGIGVKDSAHAIVSNTTFYRNQWAVKCYEKVPGQGGGRVEVDRSIIAASQVAAFEQDALSVIEFSNSLSDGSPLAGDGNRQGSVVFEDVASNNYNVKEVRDSTGQALLLAEIVFGAKL